MFHTMTNIQSGAATTLQQCIDNRGAYLRVGLRSLTVTVGWYNVEEDTSFLEWHSDNTLTKLVKVPPGLYGFKHLKAVLESGESEVTLEEVIVNGIVKLTIGEGWELKLPQSLTTLLGIGDEWSDCWNTSGTYVGGRILNFAIPKMLFVHLDQMNMSANYVDGVPSTLLQAIPAGRGGYGDIGTFSLSILCLSGCKVAQSPS